MQREIGIDNPDQRHIWKMKTFRDHLRANKDVDLAGAKIKERVAIRLFARHRVRVHPADGRVWKNVRYGRFHFFRAEARINQRVLATGRTFLWHSGGMTAQMTAQPCGMSMEGERDTAVRAIARFAAVAAKQRSGKAAPIQKQNRLLAFLETISDSAAQFVR